jgi:hypothetical protein
MASELETKVTDLEEQLDRTGPYLNSCIALDVENGKVESFLNRAMLYAEMNRREMILLSLNDNGKWRKLSKSIQAGQAVVGKKK